MTPPGGAPTGTPASGAARAFGWPAVATVALLLGALGAMNPAVALLVAGAAALIAAAFVRPELATLAGVFAIYTNAVVVAVRFHGMPYALGAVVPALLAVPVAAFVVIQRRRLVVPPETPYVLVFFFAQAMGALSARDPTVSGKALLESLLEGLLLYFLVVNAARGPRTLYRIAWVLVAAGFLMGAVPLYQQVTGAFDSDFGGFGQRAEVPFRAQHSSAGAADVMQFRLAGPIGEINRYAQVMLMVVPVGLFLVWSERRGVARILALVATGTILAGFALAFSRGAAIAALLLFCIMLALRIVSVRQALAVCLAASLLLVAVPQYMTRITSLPVVSELVLGQEAEIDGAVKGRLTEMLAAALVFSDHPVFGVGPGMFEHYCQEYGNRLEIRRLEGARQAHCLYLDLAAEHGVVGLFAFLGMVTVTMRRLLRARRRCMARRPELAHLATAYLLMIIAYLTTGIFLHLSYFRYFWLMMALGAAVAAAAEHAARRDRRPRGR
ncbi:MAG: O-antigen ligase family protein [Polyangiaceae bacterium]